MVYQFVFTQLFDRQIKNLAKRNPHLRKDLATFLETFDADLHPVIPGAAGARKARMKVSGRGKRGGYRVVFFVYVEDRVWLLTIYDKVRRADLSQAELQQISALIQMIRNADNE